MPGELSPCTVIAVPGCTVGGVYPRGGNRNHSWRATGITVFLENGGAIEMAQYMAGHADTRTTKLYDRSR